MDSVLKARSNTRSMYHFERARLNSLFMQALKFPLVLICAGAGYGKTSAVYDFTQKYKAETAWIQLSERDNVGGRFWENYTHSLSPINEQFARSINKLGFPDTIDKYNQYMDQMHQHVGIKRQIIVMDDFHIIEDPSVIRFVEHAFLNLPPGSSLFIISRSTPRINTAGLVSKGHIFNISEDDLRFTKDELAQYFRRLTIPVQPESLIEIMQDTEGWALAINLIAQSFRKAPGYGGYLRNAMKSNIFRLMDTEIWDEISEHLQNFMIRLSLIGHLSVDLLELLAGDDSSLISDLERQNAFVRRDSFINAYLIHPLFLEFLATKENLLSAEEKRKTYAIAGEWCNKNGFKIDAMSYYEKIEDYVAIAGIFLGSRSQIPYDTACYAAAVFDRTPLEVFDVVRYLASIHLRAIMCQGLWEEAIRKAEFYVSRYMYFQADEQFRTHTLSSIYYCWGYSCSQMCLKNDMYDFDRYYEKLDKCFSEPYDPGTYINKNPGGPWMCVVGTSRKNAPDEYLAAMKRSTSFLQHCYIGFKTGQYELSYGELLFYRGNVIAAESCFLSAIDDALEQKCFGIVHRALFYTLRIAVSQGNYAKADQSLKDMKACLDDEEYYNRFLEYDIALCWYYCVLGMPENVPDWLKENFSPYVYASFFENYINHMKGRYRYMVREYPHLLSYIQKMKERESFLFGRVEMLAIEACIHYKLKDKSKACAVLAEAYETASPNELLMPFIELGKDMRTLTAYVLKEPDCAIPKPWLESINRKSASYAKRQAHIVTKYKQDMGIADTVVISPRESEILQDLSHGLSRTGIAASRNLSINTVKMVINNIYIKLGAENLADAIRIATEKKII